MEMRPLLIRRLRGLVAELSFAARGRRILALSLPVALSGQLDNFVGLIDIFMVGHLGAASISAVGIANVIAMVVTIAMVSVTTGAFALVAQAIGAGDVIKASATAKQSFTLVTLVGGVLSLVGIAITPAALTFLSPTAEVAALGGPYLRLFFSGLVFLTLNFALSSCLYGAGDTRTPLLISALISTVKVGCSYLLIFGVWGLPAMGVEGAAAGTVIGRGCGVVAGFVALYSGRYRLRLLPETSYRLDASVARRILRIGIPAALQGVFRNGSNILFVKMLAMTGAATAAVAAFSIGNQVERILRRSSLAFGTAATTLVGQDIGAGRIDEAERWGWATVVVGGVGLAVVGVPFVLGAGPFMAAFTDAPEVVDMGVRYLWALVLAEPFMCASITAGGALRGAGDTRSPLYYTVVAQWLIRLPVGYVLAFSLGWDVDGLWAALVVFSVLQGGLTLRKFASGTWKSLKI
jgi:putative MATE family efflux protein